MAGIYRPRQPERTVLYRVLFHYFERFLTEYERRFEKEYGYSKFRRKLLGELCRRAVKTVSFYVGVLAEEELVPGIVAAIQTFGERINFHPHLHFLVTEGGVVRYYGLYAKPISSAICS